MNASVCDPVDISTQLCQKSAACLHEYMDSPDGYMNQIIRSLLKTSPHSLDRAKGILCNSSSAVQDVWTQFISGLPRVLKESSVAEVDCTPKYTITLIFSHVALLVVFFFLLRAICQKGRSSSGQNVSRVGVAVQGSRPKLSLKAMLPKFA